MVAMKVRRAAESGEQDRTTSMQRLLQHAAWQAVGLCIGNLHKLEHVQPATATYGHRLATRRDPLLELWIGWVVVAAQLQELASHMPRCMK